MSPDELKNLCFLFGSVGLQGATSLACGSNSLPNFLGLAPSLSLPLSTILLAFFLLHFLPPLSLSLSFWRRSASSQVSTSVSLLFSPPGLNFPLPNGIIIHFYLNGYSLFSVFQLSLLRLSCETFLLCETTLMRRGFLCSNFLFCMRVYFLHRYMVVILVVTLEFSRVLFLDECVTQKCNRNRLKLLITNTCAFNLVLNALNNITFGFLHVKLQ